MLLLNRAIMRFLLSVAALGALSATCHAQGGGSPSPTVAGQSTTGAVKTNGCRQFDSQHTCVSGEIITGAAEANAILEGGRYTADGSGPALYVWMAHACQWSQAFLKDRARFDGVQFRYYVTPQHNASAVQTMVSRSLPDFLSYMGLPVGALPETPLDPARDSILKDQSYRFFRLGEILAENGVRAPSTPVFYWIGSGNVFWATGFGRKQYATGIIASVKSAAAGLRENAGSPAAGEITAAAAEVKTLLEGGRYTADGSGPALYAFVSQTSFPSKEFFKGRAQFSGVQFRYYPLPLSTDSDEQRMQSIESRSLQDFLSYMNQTLRAPPVRQDNARTALRGDFERTTHRIFDILGQSTSLNIGYLVSDSPVWFWIAEGKVYWNFGYTPQYMTEIVSSVRSSSSVDGDQALQPTAPSTPPPAPAPSASGNRVPSSSPSPQGFNTLRVLYVFTGPDGSGPEADLTFDADGNLYGTTTAGGDVNFGAVFKLSPGPNGEWSETVLHSFQEDGKDGTVPRGGVILDKVGNVYGTTSASGGVQGCGTVFELTRGPNSTWSETVLHSFNPDANDGCSPFGDLIMDEAGDIYGTTKLAGKGGPGHQSMGTVFKLTRTSTGAWSYATVYSFNNSGRGRSLTAGLIFDPAGNLYGTTTVGGSSTEEVVGDGVAFRLTRGSDGQWAETVLHAFHNPNLTDRWGRPLGGGDGFGGKSGLVIDAAGNLYGATDEGGNCTVSGCAGIVYKLAPDANGAWTETVLHSFNAFSTHNKDGAAPIGRLVIDGAGNLYGTTPSGGPGLGGTVFRLAPDANGAWTETVLCSFDVPGGHVSQQGTHGYSPQAGLIFDAAGNLYGTAKSFGSQFTQHGLVFEIPAGSGHAASSNDKFAPSPAAPSHANPAPSSPTAAEGTDPLASIWQSDAYVGQTFRFKLEGNAIYVYGEQQELLGTLDGKEKKGAIDVYQGLVKIAPVTQCPGGRGLMQIKSWSQNRLDAKIETPVNTSEGVSCGGVLGSGRLVPWQKVTFVKR